MADAKTSLNAHPRNVVEWIDDQARMLASLKAIRSTIKEGWCKGAWARNGHGDEVDAIAEDAVAVCLFSAVTIECPTDSWCGRILDHISSHIPKSHYYGSDTESWLNTSKERVIEYNDNESISKENVLWLVDKTIAELTIK